MLLYTRKYTVEDIQIQITMLIVGDCAWMFILLVSVSDIKYGS